MSEFYLDYMSWLQFFFFFAFFSFSPTQKINDSLVLENYSGFTVL